MNEPCRELPPESLRWTCDPSVFTFKTTEEIPPLTGIVEQERPIRAIRFGLDIASPGFNIYVSGLTGTGKTTVIRTFLEEIAARMPCPGDWCYVHNFRDPNCPTILSLPAGRAKALKAEMGELVRHLKSAIPKAFESKEYEESVNQLLRENQVQQQLRVGGALEDGAPGDQRPGELVGVGKVAVVREGDLALAAGDHDRLGVLQLVRAVRGVPHVPDADPRGVALLEVVREGARHHADVAVGDDAAVPVVGDARALLAAVLEGEQAVEEQLGDVRVRSGADAHHAAVVTDGVGVLFHAPMEHAGAGRVNPPNRPGYRRRYSSTSCR